MSSGVGATGFCTASTEHQAVCPRRCSGRGLNVFVPPKFMLESHPQWDGIGGGVFGEGGAPASSCSCVRTGRGAGHLPPARGLWPAPSLSLDTSPQRREKHNRLGYWPMLSAPRGRGQLASLCRSDGPAPCSRHLLAWEQRRARPGETCAHKCAQGLSIVHTDPCPSAGAWNNTCGVLFNGIVEATAQKPCAPGTPLATNAGLWWQGSE